eukprot:10646586-Alexandrium_andersonii.AAC.1
MGVHCSCLVALTCNVRRTLCTSTDVRISLRSSLFETIVGACEATSSPTDIRDRAHRHLASPGRALRWLSGLSPDALKR